MDVATRPVTPPSAPVPGWRLLRRYQRAWLRPDVLAGLTVGAMLVPQSMAYAELAGVPPTTGLYASLLTPVAYALLGTSRHLGTGPEPGTAILSAAGVATVAGVGASSERYLALMAALALLVAFVAAAAWLLRLGFVASLLSKPVLVGYITGVGLVLLSSQLSAMAGVPIDADTFGPRIAEFLGEVGQVHPPTVVLGLGTLAVILLLRRTSPTLPSALLALTAATTVSLLLDLPAAGVATIGDIPRGLPSFAVPDVSGGDLLALVPAAFGVTLVGFSDNVLTARSVGARAGYRIDAQQELAGLAAANLGSGVLQGMPVSSSASRSAVPASLGSITSLVSLVAAGVVALTLAVASQVLSVVPRAALAAVIVAAAFAIIDSPGLRALWRVSRVEFVLAVVTISGVVVFDVLIGVLVAVGLSVAVALGRMARPEDAVLGDRSDLDGWVPTEHDPEARTEPGLLVYRFDAPLFFLNAERFRERLVLLLERNPGPEVWVVLDLEGVGEVDATAVDVLGDLIVDLHASGVDVVAVARANDRTLHRLERGGLLDPGRLTSYPTINAAVAAFRHAVPSGEDVPTA